MRGEIKGERIRGCLEPNRSEHPDDLGKVGSRASYGG